MNSWRPEFLSVSQELTDLLDFLRLMDQFRAIERTIWFNGVEGKERNGEHSFQLAMVCWFISTRNGLGLDTERILRYALVHDLVEVYAGDTPAFPLPEDVQRAILTHADKKQREEAALKRLEKEWRIQFPEMIEAIHEYELQGNEEAQFVYAMDKLVASANVFHDGGRAWKRLEVFFLDVDAYVRPRVSKHPLVEGFYEEFRTILATFPELFHRG